MIQLAGCVVHDSDGRLLLIHRRTPTRDQWEIPGGKVAEGEDMRVTAKREMHEELGVVVDVLGYIGSCDFTEDGTEFTYSWYGAVITQGFPRVTEPNIHDAVAYWDLETLTHMRAKLSLGTQQFVDPMAPRPALDLKMFDQDHLNQIAELLTQLYGYLPLSVRYQAAASALTKVNEWIHPGLNVTPAEYVDGIASIKAGKDSAEE